MHRANLLILVTLLLGGALAACSDDGAGAGTAVDASLTVPPGPEAPPGAGEGTGVTTEAPSDTATTRSPTTPSTTTGGDGAGGGGSTSPPGSGAPGTSSTSSTSSTSTTSTTAAPTSTTSTTADPVEPEGAFVRIGDDRYSFTPEECLVFGQESVLVNGPGTAPDGTPVYVAMDAEMDMEAWAIRVDIGTDQPFEEQADHWVAGFGATDDMQVTLDGDLVRATSTFVPGLAGDPVQGEFEADCG